MSDIGGYALPEGATEILSKLAEQGKAIRASYTIKKKHNGTFTELEVELKTELINIRREDNCRKKTT